MISDYEKLTKNYVSKISTIVTEPAIMLIVGQISLILFGNKFAVAEIGQWLGIFILVLLIISRKLLLISLLLGAVIGGFGVIKQQQVFNYDQYYGQKVEVWGEVVNYPYRKGSANVVKLKPIALTTNNSQKVLPTGEGLLQVKIHSYYRVEKGQTISFTAELVEAENFDGFDYRQYLANKNIVGLLENVGPVRQVAAASRFQQQINKLRDAISNNLKSVLPQPHSGLAVGMLIGTREQFSEEFEQALRKTGTAHIIAVSGFNVTVLANIVLASAKYIGRKLAILISLLAIILFLLVVGTDNLPALRATIMAIIGLLGQLWGFKTKALANLLLSAVVIIFINSGNLFDISFQLSFAASLGMITLADKLEILLKQFLPKVITEETAVTMAAILATTPISYLTFGEMAWYALPINILISPLINPIMLLSFLLLLISNLKFAFILLCLDWVALEVMVKIIDFGAELTNIFKM